MDEFRFGPDRRQFGRGGRRASDRAGYAPIIVIIDDDATRLDLSEAILAKLRFAVAPFVSAEEAILAMHALSPEIVVARTDDVQTLRGRLPVDRDGRAIPLLLLTADLTEPAALVEALRQLIRLNRAQTA